MIELPGSASVLRRSVSLPLGEPLSAEARILTLDCTEEEAQQLPGRGAQVQIGGERIRYGRRVGTRLESLERNYGGEGVASEHAGGASVNLIALDPWRDKIENIGSMTFLMQALPADVAGSGTDLTTELNAAKAWADLPENANVSIEEYNKLLSSREGVAQRLRFYPLVRRDAKTGEVIQAATPGENLQALIQEERADWQFTGGDVQRVYYQTDEWGQPAVAFEMKSYAHTTFGDFSEEHLDESMAAF